MPAVKTCEQCGGPKRSRYGRRCAHEPCRKPVPAYRTIVPELRGRVAADRYCSRECCERAHGVEPSHTPMGMHYP